MRSLKLSGLIRRNPDRPSLKQRAAALKATAAGVLRRPPADADQGRRVMMAGSLAAVIPLSALAAPAVVGAHPDQALLDAEETMLRAERIYAAARDASTKAHDLAAAELGVCPAAIRMSERDVNAISPPFARREILRCRSFHWVRTHEGDEQHNGRAWTPAGLRVVIQYAVPVFGWGGTTPKRIRRYRELLPLAEVFDARRTEIRQRHRVDELSDAYRDAGSAMSAARDALDEMRASTPEGLAVLARHLGSYDRGRIDRGWIGLLESAAIVGGVDPHAPCEPRVRTAFM